jgi:hypothetical protein
MLVFLVKCVHGRCICPELWGINDALPRVRECCKPLCILLTWTIMRNDVQSGQHLVSQGVRRGQLTSISICVWRVLDDAVFVWQCRQVNHCV